MKIIMTDGTEYNLIENCSYCQMNTAGQHSALCPMYQPPSFILQYWRKVKLDIPLDIKTNNSLKNRDIEVDK